MLSNISKSKGNQIMKFGQVVECNMRNFFLENVVEKLVPDPFLKY